MNNENQENPENLENLNAIAVIGMAGRFPKAGDINTFWENIKNGVDCITFYDEQELIDAGHDPEIVKNPDYVRAKGAVGDVDMFDAAFFGINPREAEVTDPQHRMLLECAWEAMEHAGYDSSKFDGPIGMFAGKSMDYYLLLNVYPYIRKEISAGSLQAAIGNDKDSLTTTISYRLNLTGPGITVQTSSSTSLVAVCVACQSLLTYQCDMALAGGITAGPPIKSGYMYQEGNIWSPDGHCRAFDAKAKGFVPGTGMGLVVLKRLEDAQEDGDNIWAIIRGYAVNNDGDKKVSYSAPSVDAQAEVVGQALAMAGVHPESIQYIETHGTGTNLGDPIEMTALTQAFRAHTGKKQFCAIGSVKSNIGHLDNAAGVTGLIKVALSLKYTLIPPSLHFEQPNPKIDFENSPFFVNTKLREWQTEGGKRRAGVTSLGMGGTNAHVILEEAPSRDILPFPKELNKSFDQTFSKVWPPAGPPEANILLLSAKTEKALEKMTQNLAQFFRDNPGVNLVDAAFTLAIGRRDFNYRRAVVCSDREEAIKFLAEKTPGAVSDRLCNTVSRPIVFMFSGQGSQYVNMGRSLYETIAVFREAIDRCAEILLPVMDLDLRELLYPAKDEDIEANTEKLTETRFTQPVLFMLEYALAQLWLSWGIRPVGMIGHSIGDYAAACIAGCISLEDALDLVALRGRLMFAQEKGAMLTIGLPETSVLPFIEANNNLSIAALNSPKHTVVSGTFAAIEVLEKELTAKEIFCRRLHTSHAFHSPMMDPLLDEFTVAVTKIKLNPPQIPFISGITGQWITTEEACSPQYWAKQLRQPVRFSDGIAAILKDSTPLLLEVGPGNALCLLAKEHQQDGEPVLLSSLRHVKQTQPDMVFLLTTLAHLWLNGAAIEWQSFYRGFSSRPTRVPLPTYPFERQRYWLEPVKASADQAVSLPGPVEADDKEAQKLQAHAADSKEQMETAAKTYQPRPALPNEYTAPVDDVQKGLVEIWEDILGIKPIGITDNFFDLGGHSLLATLFLSKVQELFHVRLEMRAIFEEPNIECVAKEVIKEQSKGSDRQKIEDILQELEQDNQ